MSNPTTTVSIYSLENYTFGVQDASAEDRSFHKNRLERLKQSYSLQGMGRAVEIVAAVHLHNHPHLLLLQHQNAFFLPSGVLEQGEGEAEAVNRLLKRWLKLEEPVTINEHLATWWRPNFETFIYPYCPPHITRPKEQIRVLLVELPESAAFSVSREFNLIAVPLFEIFEGSSRFGSLVASLPLVLSKTELLPVPRNESLDNVKEEKQAFNDAMVE